MRCQRIEISLDARIIGQIDARRGKRTRQDFVRDAIDVLLHLESGQVATYAQWVQQQRLIQEGGSVIPQLVVERRQRCAKNS